MRGQVVGVAPVLVPEGCGSGGQGRRDLKAPVLPWSGGAVEETFPISLGTRMGISFDPGLWRQACFPLPQTPRSCWPPSHCVYVSVCPLPGEVETLGSVCVCALSVCVPSN